MSKPTKHILVIRLSALGDVAMSIPVLRVLLIQHPELKITVLTRAFFKPLFKDLPNTSIFEADVKGRHKGIFGLWKLSRELKSLDIDAVADLHNVLRSNILKLFFGNTVFKQIDKGREEKKALVQGNQFKQLKTTHQRYANVFNNLGFAVDLSNPVFPEKAELTASIKEVIGESSSFIGVAPFAAFQGKAYPIEMMKEAISEISKTNTVLLFGGGQKEVTILDQIALNNANVINVAGKLKFEEELKVISNLNLMISMDSGNAHLAANYNVPTITIWGVTHPYAGFYPFNQNSNYALLPDRKLYPKIPTSVYGNKFPEGYENAIRTITPEQIVDKVNEVLN